MAINRHGPGTILIFTFFRETLARAIHTPLALLDEDRHVRHSARTRAPRCQSDPSRSRLIVSSTLFIAPSVAKLYTPISWNNRCTEARNAESRAFPCRAR